MIALMAFGSAFKQILAILVVSQQDTPPSSAVMIALFNTIFNSPHVFTFRLILLAGSSMFQVLTVFNGPRNGMGVVEEQRAEMVPIKEGFG